MSVLFPRSPKPRQWDYRPIYYDEDKERRKKRLEELKKEREMNEGKTSETTEFKTSIERGSFREAAERNRTTLKKEHRMINIRVLIIVVILLLAFFWFM